MMRDDAPAAVSGIPAGLISCRFGGKQLHISRIAKNALWLRAEQRLEPKGALEVCFRRMDGAWKNIIIEDYQTGEAHRDACGVLTRFCFCNEEFEREFNSAMAFYAGYIRAYSEGDVQSLTEYPDCLEESWGRDFDFAWLSIPDDKEICISLHEPALYELYLNHGSEDFLRAYSRGKGIAQLRRMDRLYIGNGFCRQLFPEKEYLGKMLRKAEGEGIAVTLVTAPDPRLPEVILQDYSGEMLVNDWGLLCRLRSYPKIEPLLGTMLNKRRKDPRMRYKPDLNEEFFRESSVNSPEYRDFLHGFGVNRMEFERCGYDFVLPEGKNSLHLPWYQINGSVYCPLRALCEHGDRAHQGDDGGCPQYCRNNRLLYPGHLKMMGRWNGLFALDDRKTEDFSGADRVVLNL